MEHKIATLEVYVSDRDDGQSSHVNYDGAARGQYKIMLNPKFLEDKVPWLDAKAPWHEFAHELGHFLAHLAKRPSHDDFFRYTYGNLPAEIEAWQIAHEEIPMKNSVAENISIESYKQAEGL